MKTNNDTDTVMFSLCPGHRETVGQSPPTYNIPHVQKYNAATPRAPERRKVTGSKCQPLVHRAVTTVRAKWVNARCGVRNARTKAPAQAR